MMKMGTKIIILIFLNVFTFYLCYHDKKCAKLHKYRVSEMNFMILSVMGGSLGLWIGMYTFHHKTKKPFFVYGVPLILFLQICLLVRSFL